LTILSTHENYADRDKNIAINSYTTFLRRPKVPHEIFATYWRDVRGPLCSRIPASAGMCRPISTGSRMRISGRKQMA
jgi:hypothetical protein